MGNLQAERRMTTAVKIDHSSIVYAFINDGELHSVEEFYNELAGNIDPAIAVRAFKVRHQNNIKDEAAPRRGKYKDATLEQMIAVGKELQIRSTLDVMEGNGFVLIDKVDPNIKNWDVLITPVGTARLRENKQVRGAFWTAVMRLWQKDSIKINACTCQETTTTNITIKPTEQNDAPHVAQS